MTETTTSLTTTYTPAASSPMPRSLRSLELDRLTKYCPRCLRICTGPHPEPGPIKDGTWMTAPA